MIGSNRISALKHGVILHARLPRFKVIVVSPAVSRLNARLKSMANPGKVSEAMPLIKLNRINKGGEILINSERIVFIETEAKTTTVHLSDGLLFSVEEAPGAVANKLEEIETARIKNAILGSGLGAKSPA